jgi:hypothetical protein
MIKGGSWLAVFHAALVALVLTSREASAIEVRNPLEYESALSAPVGEHLVSAAICGSLISCVS